MVYVLNLVFTEESLELSDIAVLVSKLIFPIYPYSNLSFVPGVVHEQPVN